jgi:hypothetical protein
MPADLQRSVPVNTYVATIRDAVRQNRRLWLAIVVLLPLLFYVAQLAVLMLRFGAPPNYVTVFDWPANILRIVRSTPSLRDIVAIGGNEWLLEIGRMNYDYGPGIAEWSVALLPARMALMLLVGMLIATNVVLGRSLRGQCAPSRFAAGRGTAAAGAALATITSVSVTWAACCGVPTWITGLTIMGMGLSTAFAIQPYGAPLLACGMALLAASPMLMVATASRRGPLPAAAAADA